MSLHDRTYLNLAQDILDNGVQKEDRTGTGTISLFGAQARYDLNRGFPLLTTKKMFINGIVHELLWFLAGDTNTAYLKDHGVHIWDAWEDENGDLGPVYGRQWRDFSGVDQIAQVIEQIKTNPDSRRLIVNAWNVGELDEMALPPCHLLFQFYVTDGKLSCQLYQRSADYCLGVPFNIASYSLLTHMIAQVCGLGVGEFIHTIGDAHIYLNHLDEMEEQMGRNRYQYASPELILNPEVDNIFDFRYDDIVFSGYESFSTISAPISV